MIISTLCGKVDKKQIQERSHHEPIVEAKTKIQKEKGDNK